MLCYVMFKKNINFFPEIMYNFSLICILILSVIILPYKKTIQENKRKYIYFRLKLKWGKIWKNYKKKYWENVKTPNY